MQNFVFLSPNFPDNYWNFCLRLKENGMNVLLPGETIKINDYEIAFSDPQSYTLIQIKEDHFTWLALVGGLVTMLGLFLAFYLQPTKVWAIQAEGGTWTVFGQNRKGGALFRDRFIRAAGGEDHNASS